LEYVDQSENNLVTDVNAYVAADFYVVPFLKTLVAAKFKDHLTSLWNSDNFPVAVETIYTETVSTDRALRDLVLDTIIKHASVLLGPSISCTSTALTSVMDRVAELGKDLSIRMLSEVSAQDRWSGFRKVQCQQCQHIWADPRAIIPDMDCPGCHEFKGNWDRYEVE
jgi:hypothetical protein